MILTTMDFSAGKALRSRFRQAALLLLGVLLSVAGRAQGWEVTFGGNRYDEGTAVAEAIDGGYIMVGYSESFGEDRDLDVLVVRTDIDGTILWQRVYDEGFMEHAWAVLTEDDGSFLVVGDMSRTAGEELDVYLLKATQEGKTLWSRTYGSSAREVGKDIVKTPDGGYLIVGYTENTSNGEDDILLLKVDANGEEEWTKFFGGDKDDRGESVVVLEDGYAFVGGSENPVGFDTDIVIYKVDKEGELVWSERIATDEADYANDLVATQDGGLALTGLTNDNSDAYIIKFDGNGNQQWSKTVGGEYGDEGKSIVELADGSLVITGQTESSPSNPDILVAKFDKNGNQQWLSILGDDGFVEDARSIVATKVSNGFAVFGYKSPDFFGILNNLYLVKTDERGNTITNVISGKVFRDVDRGCNAYDLTKDVPLKEWLVRVSGKERTYFGTTDADGNYSIRVDTGAYNVSVLPVNEYWESCAGTGYEITLANFYDTTSLNFPVRDVTECPYLEVDVSTPFLSVCSEIDYSVAYCNIGTVDALDAYVEVTLDETLTFVSATLPVSDQAGNTYRFDLGTIASTACGSFTISTQLACEGIAQGQAGLVSARIFPDTRCTEPDPQWDGSSILVECNCNESRDSVNFRIKNVGDGDMSGPKSAIVIEDDLVLITQPFDLDAGEQISLDPVKVENGASYRIIAEQSEFHPGRSYPTSFVEGCVQEGEPFRTGQVTMFPENDLDPNISIDIQEIEGSNTGSALLKGYPKGYRDSIIATDDDITYTVLFRNFGTDTVTRVVIRDTLSPLLDITTVIPGASNYPYDFEVYDNGILKITFSEIELLPGGSAEDNASYGFVKFRVSQKPNNPVGAIIENRAAIFFDYYSPLQTNQVRYFLGDFPSYIEVKSVTGVDQDLWPGVKINVYPNPFKDAAVFEIEGRSFDELTLRVFDPSGRLIRTDRYAGNKILYYRNQLPAGLYFFRLETRGQLISSGKLMVR